MNASSLLGVDTTDDIGAILDGLLGMKTGVSCIAVNKTAFFSGLQEGKWENIRPLLSGETCSAAKPLALEY